MSPQWIPRIRGVRQLGGPVDLDGVQYRKSRSRLARFVIFTLVVSPGVTEAKVAVQQEAPVCRVAVVGGGIGGAAFAHYFTTTNGNDARTTVDPCPNGRSVEIFEGETVLGGRLQSIHADGVKVELGGTFYSPRLNPTIAALFDIAGVNTYPLDDQLAASDLIVWNREGLAPHLMLRHEPQGQYTRDLAKVALRWGVDFGKTLNAANEFRSALRTTLALLGANATATFSTLPELLELGGLARFVNTTSADFLGDDGVSAEFVATILSALTDAIYSQNGEAASAFNLLSEVAVIGSIPGVRTSVGGNQALVTQLLARCSANAQCIVRLNRTIAEIQGSVTSGYTLLGSLGPVASGKFDAVVFASPFERSLTKIRILRPDGTDVPLPAPRAFAQTVATVVRGRLDPAYFGGPSVLGRDECILATADASAAPFNLLWWRGRSNVTNESIYLIHSDDDMSEPLKAMFFSGYSALHTKRWTHAYPLQHPQRQPLDFPPVVLENGIVYMNSIETVASSMETTAISARNAARLLFKRHLRVAVQ